MKRAYVFPGQGAQYPGMGADLCSSYPEARDMFDAADEHLGFSLSKVMFEGTAEELQETHITQPAVFLHAVVSATCLSKEAPEGVAGHSLGELSALVVAAALTFLDALSLVRCRAEAMEEACQARPSTMAAVLATPVETIEEICATISKEETVVVANYNCPGQVVISGTLRGVQSATEALQAAATRRVIPLPVGGAFHSPLMAPAQQKLSRAIEEAPFQRPICPIYQNTDGQGSTEVSTIRSKLMSQLTAPVRWEKLIEQMRSDGYTHFVEHGPGKVLQGLIKKISPQLIVTQASAP